MRKSIEEITFNEFCDWMNCRAQDGKWCLITFMTSVKVRDSVLKKTRFVIGKKRKIKKQNQIFNDLKAIHFNMNAELEWW